MIRWICKQLAEIGAAVASMFPGDEDHYWDG